ncbi:hypothetical protein Vadar_011178 [Vaccinium darrowii]|uniref:Uncharacterized protein n=1 Tax=Vaccinium darrowii TaxID=229202 RepID=A0ACB7X9H9_9ERIC|nr:hypothetical protein Vadar_011178 [Vaccinium darrowii]
MAPFRQQTYSRSLFSSDKYSSFTVYVDNLPNGVGVPWFHKFFSNFGVIMDLYLPIRRSIRTGNRFGFIRYVSTNGAQQAVAKGNGIWIGKKHLIVERALYDKFSPKEGYYEVKGRSKPSARIEKQNQEHNGVNLPQTKEIEKRITLNVQPVASEWLTRSAVAKLKVFTTPDCVQKAFIDLNFKEVRVKSLGGMNLIISFQSKEDRLAAIRNSLMTNWFSFFKPWNGEVAGISRLIWLNCRGMPLSVWNARTFKSIGALWGDFITLDGTTLKEESYEVGRLLIATDCNHKIDEWINITVKGRNHKVRVWEEDCNEIFCDSTIRDWVQKQQLMSLIPQSTTTYHDKEKDKVWMKKLNSGTAINLPSDPNNGSKDGPSRIVEVEGIKALMAPLIISELPDKQDKLVNQRVVGTNLEDIQEEGEESNVGETPDLGLINQACGPSLEIQTSEKATENVVDSMGDFQKDSQPQTMNSNDLESQDASLLNGSYKDDSRVVANSVEDSYVDEEEKEEDSIICDVVILHKLYSEKVFSSIRSLFHPILKVLVAASMAGGLRGNLHSKLGLSIIEAHSLG